MPDNYGITCSRLKRKYLLCTKIAWNVFYHIMYGSKFKELILMCINTYKCWGPLVQWKSVCQSIQQSEFEPIRGGNFLCTINNLHLRTTLILQISCSFNLLPGKIWTTFTAQNGNIAQIDKPYDI